MGSEPVGDRTISLDSGVRIGHLVAPGLLAQML